MPDNLLRKNGGDDEARSKAAPAVMRQYPRPLPRILELHRGPFDFDCPRTSNEDIYESPGALLPVRAGRHVGHANQGPK